MVGGVAVRAELARAHRGEVAGVEGEHGLTVPLLADPDHETSRAYGVVGPGGLVRRSIFIVDPDGIVRYRHVALLGLRYKDVEHLASALSLARDAAAAR